MRTVRRKTNDETFGQNLSDVSVVAFQNRQHCDVCIITSEGEQLRAHQVVLAKSPTLSAAMRQSEVRCLPEATLIFPEFKKRSIVMLLQFLYTGEVDLVSASQLLVEFQELCRILKLNPQVRKTKYAEQQAAAPIITETRKHNCNGCSASFDKHSKLIFHLQHCENTEAAPEVNDSQNEKPNNAEVEKLPENVPDEIVSDEIVKNELDPCLGGSGFQMPDNFDLPDEIIQEQLPAARFTSTPIRYANTDIKKSELEVNKRRKEHVSKQQDPRKEVLKSKGFSVAEDLAEKKKRMLLKLRGDEVVEKKGKRPFKDNFVPSRKLVPGAKKARLDKDAVVKKMGKKRRNTESSESSDKEASGDDISEEDETDDETDEEIELKKPPPRVLSSDKKLAVSVQLEGKERIMEFMLYKLKFLTEPITAEDEEDKKTKSIKLAKVGKRIKRIISEDSSEDSSGETVKKLKKEPTIVRTVKKESDEPPPRPISPVKKSEPSTSFIAKLPRIPKIPKVPASVSSEAGPSSVKYASSSMNQKSHNTPMSLGFSQQHKKHSSDPIATKSDTSP